LGLIGFLTNINKDDLSGFFENVSIPINDDENKEEAYGKIGVNLYNELKTPYALYNWELFFHTPVILADKLSKSQHFEDAMKWYHYVFNPFANDSPDAKRVWRFLPFREADSENYLENLFGYEWELVKSPAGAFQWTPKNGAGAGTVPDAHDPSQRHAPMMLTTDLSLRMDPIYAPISKRYHENPDLLADAFARVWPEVALV